MRFPPSFLDEIRDRLPISEVIGQRVSWDKRKTNVSRGDYWACCPFHGEKTPSFHCENRKGRYHCFGCGVSGDHFRFLVELDGLSFPEAVERLADQAGLPMPVMTKQEREAEDRRTNLFDVMEMATRFFEEKLQSGDGAKARAYLRERGLSPATQKTFRIGYAPDSRNALKEFLASKGVGRDQIEGCGLVRHGPDIPVSYDWFRDRVMFPIPNSRGRIIAFGGRALRSDVPAKYMNSPETELFHKSNVLYNFAQARRPVQDKGQVIAAEGYMDVIALHQAGFENAVAPLGTALTENQMELLWRLHSEPILCFDGDEAGLRAAWRAIDMILPGLKPGRTARFALLPEGKDPDDLIREEGPQAMREILDDATTLASLLWMRETGGGTFDTPERRAELESRMRQVVAQIRDESVRRHYAQDASDRLAAFFGATQNQDTARAGRPSGPRPYGDRSGSQAKGRLAASTSLLASSLVKRHSARIPLREALLLCTVIHHPAILAGHFDEFAELPLTHATAKSVHHAVLDTAAHWEADDDQHWPPREAVAEALERKGLADAVQQMDSQLRFNRLWQALPDAAFEDALDGWRQARTLHVKTHTLMTALREAEHALASEESEENFSRLVQIREELAREEGTEALIENFGLPSGRPARNY